MRSSFEFEFEFELDFESKFESKFELKSDVATKFTLVYGPLFPILQGRLQS